MISSEVVAALAVVASLISALAAAWAAVMSSQAKDQSQSNASGIREIHLTVNSRMDELLAASKAQARLEGADSQRATDKATQGRQTP